MSTQLVQEAFDMRSLSARIISTLKSDKYWQLTVAVLALIGLWYYTSPHFYHGPTNKVEATFVAVLAMLWGAFTVCSFIFNRRMKAVIFPDQSLAILLSIMAISVSWAFRFG